MSWYKITHTRSCSGIAEILPVSIKVIPIADVKVG